MTNAEIVRLISIQISIAAMLALLARITERHDQAKAERLREKARPFILHSLKLIAANKSAVEQWMENTKSNRRIE